MEKLTTADIFYRQRAVRIAALADEDLLSYPDEKYVATDVRSFSIYERVRVKAATFAGLDNWGDTPLSREDAVAAILSMIPFIFSEGVRRLSEITNMDRPFIELSLPRAMIVNHGLLALSMRSEPIVESHSLFLIMALDDLLCFVDQLSMAYRTAKQLRSKKESDASNHGMIGAMTSLASAQMAFELGSSSMEKSLARAEIDRRNAVADERELQAAVEINKRSSAAKKAADARHDGSGGSREKQGKIREIWAEGKYSSRDICAEQECAGLEMSFSSARKALRNTADPD